MSSSNAGKLVSILSGLATGGVFGVYLAQNYVVPDVGQLLSLVQDKASDYTRKDTPDSTDKNVREE